MLIDLTTLLRKYQMELKGVIHGGAHECEEMEYYKKNGLTEDKVIWFEANPNLKEKMEKINSALKIYNYAICEESDKTLTFYVTNNFQSSSILPLKTHKRHYPNIQVREKIEVQTIRMDDFFSRNNLDIKEFNFLNLDIQGAELLAIKGMGELLTNMEMLYLEINKEELYENCALIYDLDAYLEEKNFVRLDTKWTGQGWGDAFYLRRDIYRQKLREIPALTAFHY